MLCIRGTSHMALCPSVRPSVTRRCSTKTAKRITQTTPHDSPGTVVFWRQRSPRNSTGSPPRPTGAPNAGGVGQNRRLSTNNQLYLENGVRTKGHPDIRPRDKRPSTKGHRTKGHPEKRPRDKKPLRYIITWFRHFTFTFVYHVNFFYLFFTFIEQLSGDSTAL